jgi:hypothetical protein
MFVFMQRRRSHCRLSLLIWTAPTNQAKSLAEKTFDIINAVSSVSGADFIE